MIVSTMPTDPIERRLRDCFHAVFPSLREEEIDSASPESVQDWDSIATVRLASVIEEEFSVVLEPERNVSFSEILSLLREHLELA